MKRIAFISICFLLTLFAASCEAAVYPPGSGPSDDSGVPSGIEIVHVQSDSIEFDSLQKVEEYSAGDHSAIVVQAVARKNLGQIVETTYDYEFKKDLPDAGYTKWEIEVTKVHKGDVKAGDKLVLLLQYYIWTYENGAKQLITGSSLKPAVKNKEYLLILIYDEYNKGYWPVCDYEGMFSIPTEDLKRKAKAGTMKQSDDPDVYDGEHLQYLIPVYKEVVQKYFS